MSDDTLVTAAEIARLAGVGRAAVSNWRKRHPDFPAPAFVSGTGPVFQLVEVKHWLRSQGKMSEVGVVEALWRVLEAGQGEAELVALVADVAEYLCDPKSVELPDWVRKELDDMGDVPVDELIESLSALLFLRQQRQHLVTPAELADLMVALAEPVTGTVFDPACGPGNVLLAACEAGAERLVGQEVDAALARLARARLRSVAKIVDGDSLLGDAFSDVQADVVLCDPPFGLRHWGHEELAVDSRWAYGFPPKGEPELAWVQHCLAHAKPGGTVVLTVPSGVAFRRSGRAIRQELLRRGAVRAVIALPPGLLMSTGIPIHLWVLRNPSTSRVDPVLLVDAGQHRPQRRGRANWASISADVLEAWQEFQADGSVAEIPGKRRAVDAIELLDEEVNLNPAKHLPLPPKELDLEALLRAREQLLGTLDELGQLGQGVPEVAEAAPGRRTMQTVQQLAKAGALELRRQLGPLELDDEGGAGPLVVTGRDVATGAEPSARLVGSQDEPIRLHVGDLVVPLITAGEGRVRTRVIEVEGMVLGPNLQLIRVDAEQLDVWFLAGQLRSTGAARAGSATASGAHRVDVRGIEIPLPDLAEQRRLGTAFRRLMELESGLEHAMEVGRRFAHVLIDGLADGTVSSVE